ncbi:MAG TPA: hypothetical protein VFS45_06460, partial [Sphingomicrobium sp.]|nr:hypothetical protein [Sphingomicrobium sp.]
MPILPELILTAGAIVLMMVAAFTGRRGSGLTSWASVGAPLSATVAPTSRATASQLVTPPLRRPAKAATIISAIAPTVRISSG